MEAFNQGKRDNASERLHLFRGQTQTHALEHHAAKSLRRISRESPRIHPWPGAYFRGVTRLPWVNSFVHAGPGFIPLGTTPNA